MLKSAKTARAVLLGIAIAAAGAGPPALSQTVQERFGSRAPRTCPDQTAPARGAIKAAEAARYFICNAEYVTGSTLYLVENVNVRQVGGGVPYTPNLGAFREINVRVPLYPIRGSYVSYQCADKLAAYDRAPNTDCGVYEHPNATGYCYKTTFGDWSCHMSDRTVTSQSRKSAPPK